MLRMPELLGIPWSTRDRVRQKLVANPPAAVAPLDDIDPAGLVPLVGVVVTGPEVAVLVEGQFLRVAQADGENLQVRAVGVAAQDRAGIGQGDGPPFLRLDIQAAVANAEVELAVELGEADLRRALRRRGDVSDYGGGAGRPETGVLKPRLVREGRQI